MGVDAGWVCLHRKVLNNPTVMKDANHFAIWNWLLLNAAHSEERGYFGRELITLEPGQLLTTRQEIADALSINPSTVQRVLSEFESCSQIEQQTDRHKRLVSIVSWHKYQFGEQQVNNKRTTNEQQVNNLLFNKTNKQINNKTRTPRDSCYCSDFSGPVDDDAQALLKLLMDMKGEDEP